MRDPPSGVTLKVFVVLCSVIAFSKSVPNISRVIMRLSLVFEWASIIGTAARLFWRRPVYSERCSLWRKLYKWEESNCSGAFKALKTLFCKESDTFEKRVKAQRKIDWVFWARCWGKRGVSRNLKQLHLTRNSKCISYGSRSLFTCAMHRDSVEVIIEDMMLHPEDMSSASRACLLLGFEPILDPFENTADFTGTIWHAIIAKNSMQFQLFARYFGAGLSFSQVPQVMLETKELLYNEGSGSISESVVSSYTCFICVMKLQRIAKILWKYYPFSIVSDMATNMAIEYWGIRIRIRIR